MPNRPVPAASSIRALPSKMADSVQDPEVALIYSRSSELDAARLAGSLRGQGHQARLVPASPHACAETLRAAGPPLLLVATSDELDTPVLRSRLARELEREHSWLDRTRPGCGHALFRQVCARMNTLRCAETIEAPFVPRLELAVPQASAASSGRVPTPPPPRRVFRVQLLVWPLIGATVAALGLLAFQPAAEEATPPVQVHEPALEPATVANAPEEPVVSVAIRPPAVPPAPPATPAASTPAPAAVMHERVAEADGVLVYAARERARDWYAAMNLCRGRTLAGIRGWSTPSSKQLNALAKARVLPDGALWSRTRALKAEGVAFVVHGRAGTARAATKSETTDMAVCVRKRPSQG